MALLLLLFMLSHAGSVGEIGNGGIYREQGFRVRQTWV